jgi:hypothetical protein
MNVFAIRTAETASKVHSGRSSHKSPVTVVAPFALAAVFTLAGAPVAAASTNDPIPSTSAAVGFDNTPRSSDCGQPDCWPGLRPPGLSAPQQPAPWHGQWDRLAPSASTEAANSDLASPPIHNGPLCPGFPGTCPP